MKTNNTKKKIRIIFTIIGLVILILTTTEITRAETWTQKADMPTARSWSSASVVDGKIYAIGGMGGVKKVEEYDPATDTWTQKTDMPTGRTMLSTSVVDGKIYAIGGADRWPNGTKLATVEEYDPATDTWTQKADMPTPRSALTTSAVNGKIYAIGGFSGLQLSTVEEYDPAADTWVKKADMPTARGYHSSCVVDGKIYAIGGILAGVWPALPTVEQYDPLTDTWTKKADMPAPRAFNSAVVDEKIYAFGGNYRRGGLPNSRFTQYDPATDTWTTLDDMPVRMLGMGTSVVGGRVYIMGGSSSPYPYNPFLSTVWEYDTGLRVPSSDFNGDGTADIKDLLRLIESWGQDDPLCDIAPRPFGDGIIDAMDLELLMSYWGQPVDDPTLISHWAFDETEGMFAADSAGHNDAVVFGGTSWQPGSGKVDGALLLDGIDGCAIAGPPINPADGPFSILAWINGGAPGQVVVSQQIAANWLTIDADGSLMTELKGTDSATDLLFSETFITDGQWHRIGFVWDGSKRMLYVDGVVVAEDTQPGLDSSQMGLYIGVDKNYTPGTFFSGLIDDVRIYNRVVHP